MSPTIENHDKLIVEHWNGEQIQDNKIYVFCYNNEFFVKRLSKNIDEIIEESRLHLQEKFGKKGYAIEKMYFEDYKKLENKTVVVEKIFDKADTRALGVRYY